jgi:hypothetical protein
MSGTAAAARGWRAAREVTLPLPFHGQAGAWGGSAMGDCHDTGCRTAGSTGRGQSFAFCSREHRRQVCVRLEVTADGPVALPPRGPGAAADAPG